MGTLSIISVVAVLVPVALFILVLSLIIRSYRSDDVNDFLKEPVQDIIEDIPVIPPVEESIEQVSEDVPSVVEETSKPKRKGGKKK